MLQRKYKVGNLLGDKCGKKITGLIVDSYDTDTIKIYARTENADIDTLTNKILLIDNEDISVVVTGIRI